MSQSPKLFEMKIQTLLLSLTLCCPVLAHAQKTATPAILLELFPDNYIYEGVYRYSPPIFYSCKISGTEEVDTCSLRVTYEASVMIDTLSTIRYKDRMVSLIGNSWYLTYGETMFKKNSSFSLSAESPEKEQLEIEDGYENIFPMFIYRDMVNKIIINKCQIPELKDIFFRYNEPQPEFNWNVSNELRTIKGYTCQKAGTRYAGREWIVWFTPEIPVDCGLWKFSGLPGLILEAYDTKEEYHFTLRSIEQVAASLNMYNTKEKAVSRADFRKTEYNLHNRPILYSQGADGYHRIHDSRRGLTGKEIFTVDNFVYPYNPIELE